MTGPIHEDLQAHLTLCREILATVQRENHALTRGEDRSQFEFYRARKQMMPRLADSVCRLRAHRCAWQQLPAEQRERESHIPPLLRENQDLIMKIIVLDRENEQHLVRRGMVPSRQLPSVNTQRPHCVATLYQKGATQAG